MAGGGSGPSGTTQYDWNPTMSAWWAGNKDFPGVIQLGANAALGQSYEPYSGERVVGLDPMEQQARQGIYDLATRFDAMPDVWAGRQTAMDAAQGKLTNDYKGASPYYQSVVQQGIDDITRNYTNTTAKDLDHLMAQSGMLGSTGHIQALANNQAALGKTIGNYVAGMGNDQYNRSAQLDQQDLDRQMQGIPLAQGGQALSTDLLTHVGQAGTAQRAIDQQRADVGYGNWQDQRNWGWNQTQRLANLLSQAQGGIGGQATTYGQGVSPWQTGLGAALMGYGMFRS